jgi:hypothetical protein
MLVAYPEGKRLVGRTRRKWEDNITMDVKEMGYKNVDWIDLGQGRIQ